MYDSSSAISVRILDDDVHQLRRTDDAVGGIGRAFDRRHQAIVDVCRSAARYRSRRRPTTTTPWRHDAAEIATGARLPIRHGGVHRRVEWRRSRQRCRQGGGGAGPDAALLRRP